MSLSPLEEDLGFGTGDPVLGLLIFLPHLNWREGREGTSDGDSPVYCRKKTTHCEKNYSILT